MNGTVTFSTVEDMAKFLKEFTGSSAVFTAEQKMDGTWVITFNGGY